MHSLCNGSTCPFTSLVSNAEHQAIRSVLKAHDFTVLLEYKSHKLEWINESKPTWIQNTVSVAGYL